MTAEAALTATTVLSDPYRTVVYEEIKIATPGASASTTITKLIESLAPGRYFTSTITTPDAAASQALERASFSREAENNETSDATSTVPSPLGSTISTTSQTLTSPITLSTNGYGSSSTLPISSSPSSSDAAASTGLATSSSSLQGKQGLSSGAVAGVAVGSLIAGAVIALLVACAFGMFKRKKRHPDYARAAGYELKEHSPITSDAAMAKGPAVAVTNFPSTSAAAIVEDALPLPADNDTIRTTLVGLRTQINNHVLSFYRSNPSQEQASLEALSAVVAGSGSPPEEVQVLLRDHRTRTAAMRFILAWVVTTRMDSGGSRSSTFLPDEVASFQELMMGGRGSDDDPSRGAFLSKWRTITAYLMSFNVDRHDQSQSQKIGEAVMAVDSALNPYAKTETQERLMNLEEIMRRAERLAFMLFAQPKEFSFDWESVEQGIVAFPGVLQTVDESGRQLSVVNVVLEKDIVRV